MTTYKFKRTTASFQEDGSVMLQDELDGEEEIEVADDWWEGRAEKDRGNPHEATGYVGEGYSKYGIYVGPSIYGIASTDSLTCDSV